MSETISGDEQGSVGTARTAIYPGTFDPITNGHIDIIARTARMFDRVIVALAVNSAKQTLFNEEERFERATESLRDYGNVVVKRSEGLIVEFAAAEGALALVRGV